MSNKKYSLLYPLESAEYKKLSPTALHDLGLDQICKQLTPKESEQNLIMNTMSKLCADPFVTQYRCDIFEDMIHHKEMRESLMKILDKINFLKDYGCLSKEYEEQRSGIFCIVWTKSMTILSVWMPFIIAWRIKRSIHRGLSDCAIM